MKQESTNRGARDRTRRAILEAMADVISEAGGIGFSVQAIADQAGVTHRTIYNHFPTRDALCEGFAAYVDEVLIESTGMPAALKPTFDAIPELSELYKLFAARERHCRAYVMLMIGNRQPSQTWRSRSRLVEQEIALHSREAAPISPKLAAAAVRMFASTMGWHLLTDQCGLTTDEAATASRWATQTLLDAAIGGRRAPRTPKSSKRGQDASRRR
jgi:AcrR family transcriptional regulator